MIRRLCLATLFGLAGIMLLCNQAPMSAQGTKKDDLSKTNQSLQKSLKEKEAQIQKLQLAAAQHEGKVAQLQQRIKQLEADLKTKKAGKDKKGEKTAAQLRQELDKANQSIKDKDDMIASLQQDAPKATSDLSKEVTKLRKTVRELETLKKAPFVHARILKLKKSDDEQVKLVTDEAAKTLAKIDGVRGFWLGTPAEMGTPELAQKGYQLGVVVLLDDAESLQKFLEDPLHKQFTEKLADYWERPVVYDIQRDKDDAKKK